MGWGGYGAYGKPPVPCFVHVPEERENAGDYFMLTCIIVENSDDEKNCGGS